MESSLILEHFRHSEILIGTESFVAFDVLLTPFDWYALFQTWYSISIFSTRCILRPSHSIWSFCAISVCMLTWGVLVARFTACALVEFYTLLIPFDSFVLFLIDMLMSGALGFDILLIPFDRLILFSIIMLLLWALGGGNGVK